MSKPKYTKKGLNGKQIDQAEFYFGNNSFSGTDMVATMTISGTENTNGSHVLGSIQTLSYSIHQEKQPIRSIGNVNAKDYVMGPRTIAGSLVFAVFDRHFAYAAMADIKREYKNYHFLADELPPFDITITYANEYGANSKLALYGVRLVNEGQVMSINDIYTENTYQFVATDIDYLDTQNLNDSILNKNMLNLYDPDSMDLPSNDDYELPALEDEEEVEVDKEVIEANNYKVEIKNIKPYFYDAGIYGSADIYFTPNPKEECDMFIKGFENDFEEKSIKLYPDSVFPISLTNLKPGRYQVFVTGNWLDAISKFFTITTVKYDGEKEFTASFMVYEKGDDKGECYAKCESSKMLDGVEYIEKKKYDEQPNATWFPVMSPEAKRHFVLRNLKPETKYLLRGVYQGKVTTDHIEFITTRLEGLYNRFDYIKDFLDYNSPLLLKESVKQKASIYESIINAAKEYAKDKDSITVTEAILAIKDDNNMAYVDFCIMMAAAYENQILWATSDTITPPVLYSAAQSAIIVDQDTSHIEIERIGYCPTTVTAQQFDNMFDKSIYRLPGSEGLYRIKRFDTKSNISVPMLMPIFSQSYREKLLSSESLINKTREQAVNRVKSNISESIKYLSDKDKEFVTLEYAEENNHFKTCAMQPQMIEHTDTYVEFIHPTEVCGSMYCCIQKTDELLKGKPVHKKIVKKDNNYYAKFDVLEQGLMSGERYSVWYETLDFSKISPIFSFIFNKEDDEILIAKNKIMIKNLFSTVKKYSYTQSNELIYEYLYNKIIDLDESLYSNYSEIYDKLIMDIYTNKDLSKKDTYLLMYYMFEIFMALTHENQSSLLSETKYYQDRNSIVVTPKDNISIHRVVIEHDGITKLPVLHSDSDCEINLDFIKNYGNLGLIYFTTEDMKIISKPIVIDYDHRIKIYGTYKEGRC